MCGLFSGSLGYPHFGGWDLTPRDQHAASADGRGSRSAVTPRPRRSLESENRSVGPEGASRAGWGGTSPGGERAAGEGTPGPKRLRLCGVGAAAPGPGSRVRVGAAASRPGSRVPGHREGLAARKAAGQTDCPWSLCLVRPTVIWTWGACAQSPEQRLSLGSLPVPIRRRAPFRAPDLMGGTWRAGRCTPRRSEQAEPASAAVRSPSCCPRQGRPGSGSVCARRCPRTHPTQCTTQRTRHTTHTQRIPAAHIQHKQPSTHIPTHCNSTTHITDMQHTYHTHHTHHKNITYHMYTTHFTPRTSHTHYTYYTRHAHATYNLHVQHVLLTLHNTYAHCTRTTHDTPHIYNTTTHCRTHTHYTHIHTTCIIQRTYIIYIRHRLAHTQYRQHIPHMYHILHIYTQHPHHTCM